MRRSLVCAAAGGADPEEFQVPFEVPRLSPNDGLVPTEYSASTQAAPAPNAVEARAAKSGNVIATFDTEELRHAVGSAVPESRSCFINRELEPRLHDREAKQLAAPNDCCSTPD